jgi:hypothetical protein
MQKTEVKIFSVQVEVFWVTMLCSVAVGYQRFEDVFSPSSGVKSVVPGNEYRRRNRE